MSVEESRARLVAAAEEWAAATAVLRERLREHIGAIDLAGHPDADRWAWVRRLPSSDDGAERRWWAEPCHPYFGDGIALHTVVDFGEAGERGAGGPYVGLSHLLVSDLPDGPPRTDLVAALEGVRRARQDYQVAVRDCRADLRPVAVMDDDLLRWLDEIPTGGSPDGRSWRAEPRAMPGQDVTVAILFERDADDPRTSTLVGLALMTA